mmetsp:Transcript_50289/g.112958  ORF Transcript_50289/g.112958 Transcript_50289/m.112958 type:complete len:202 (+) Transcript_50289:85-690(+)
MRCPAWRLGWAWAWPPRRTWRAASSRGRRHTVSRRWIGSKSRASIRSTNRSSLSRTMSARSVSGPTRTSASDTTETRGQRQRSGGPSQDAWPTRRRRARSPRRCKRQRLRTWARLPRPARRQCSRCVRRPFAQPGRHWAPSKERRLIAMISARARGISCGSPTRGTATAWRAGLIASSASGRRWRRLGTTLLLRRSCGNRC